MVHKHKNSYQTQLSPAQILREIFLEHRARNAAYSTRAYARDLGMSQTLLSLILNGKRPLTLKQASQICVLINMSTEDSQSLMDATLLALPDNSKSLSKLKKIHTDRRAQRNRKNLFKDYNVERFKVLSQWYHIAILDLTTTKKFKSDVRWIAERLGISTIEARDAIERLIDLGLLEKTQGGLSKTDSQIYFVTQKSEPAVRAFHRQMISKAISELDKVSDKDFSKREISSITMAVRGDRIVEARKRIKDFQKELAAFLTEGECDELFQLNLQFFQLSKTIKELK